MLQTVLSRIQPFLKTKEDDSKYASEPISNGDPRQQFVSMYRDGQRQILEDIIVKLKTMISEFEEEEGEDEQSLQEQTDR